jgi:eukaryotic-like serine/threonine-protein kinase
VDAGQVEYLYNRLLNTNPVELPVILEALKDHRGLIVERLWAVLEYPQADSGQRFQAACALAHYDVTEAGLKWDTVSRFISDRLLASVVNNPSYYTPLIKMLRPVRDRLLDPLATIFRDKNKKESERSLATSVLADYASDQLNVLADLLMDAAPEQFAILFPRVDGDKIRAVSSLRDELSRNPPERAGEEVREGLARRQANAAIVLFRLGEVDPLWLSLRQGPDPRRRTYLIHRLAPYGIDPQSLIRRLPVEPSASARAAILMSLGEFPPGQLPDDLRRELAKQLLDYYARDPDPGLHAAAGWLLTGWGFTDDLRAIDRSLAGSQPASGRYWFVNQEGQTFVVIPGPVTFLMGSPPDEPGRNSVEGQHSRTIPRSFAVAAREVTVREFRRFLKDVGQQMDESFQDNLRDFSPDHNGPILYVTWFQAAKYCRWLSDREGVKPDQMCYPEVKDIKPGMKLPKDYLTREGYRLPTEGEWEFACRSGTSTPWELGGEELVDRYARFLRNAKDTGTLHQQAWPTGQLKPNRFGLFDMHGNVYEWCHDRIYQYPVGEDREEPDLVVTDGSEEKNHRLIRGGSFSDFPSLLRSAYRDSANPSIRFTAVGFRVVRTCARP